MDLRYSREYEAYREEVRSFLSENWPLQGEDAELPQEKQVEVFRERAIDRGYLARSIPRKYGGSEQPSDVLRAAILREEWAKARAPRDAVGIGPQMLVPTLIEHGAEWQKEKFVAPTIRGEMIWCQGYSEPGSGSDLASLKTRAELEDGEWVINGQKIWTTGAHFAHYMFCLCRTEPDAGKHGGISYLLIDMKTPGIDVRPLRQMTGGSDFNEVFLNDVRVPEKNIVGKRGEGWIVSRSTLKHERNLIGDANRTRFMFDQLVKLAKETEIDGRPAIEDPTIRQRLVALEGMVASHQYEGYRQLTCAAQGQEPGLAGMMNKLISTNIGHGVTQIALDLLGDEGLLAPLTDASSIRSPRGGAQGWISQYMWSLGIAIAGGTANIQRNVIAERGLGLPRDAAAQRGTDA